MITSFLIDGELVNQIVQLSRFFTLDQEVLLAKKSVVNSSQTLEKLGVEKNFCLNHHLSNVHSSKVTH
jgi:hypothetical protein